MTKILIVGLGSFIGGIARYGLSGLIHRYAGGSFPFGTWAVNVIGCFFIGGVLHLVEDRAFLSPNVRLFVAIGLLGGFTTFSSFGYETFELLRDRQIALALLNVVGNVLLGLCAVWTGRTLLRFVGV